MKLSLSKAFDCVRKWETQGTEINGILIAVVPSALVVKFQAHAAIHAQGVILTAENGFELSVVLTESMTFTYNDALLEIRMEDWRLCLYEPKSNHSLRIVK